MPSYSLSKKALKDLTIIWEYSFDNWSEKRADLYYNQIINECKLISKNPEIGKSYSRVLNDLRGRKINKHIIFYKILDDKITVVRILHEKMDLVNRLKE